MKYRILKRIGLWLFISAFVLNVVVTSYANSLVKTYNTGATEVAGAFIAGGGPFVALIGAALLAAGLVYEIESDDPVDDPLEYFVHNCIVGKINTGTAISYIYENIEIDENGNINYKQVIDNINAYVEAGNISISTGEAVTFEKGILCVAPEIISSMSKDFRNWYTGSVCNNYGLRTYIDALGNYGLTLGWNSSIPVDSDLYNLYNNWLVSNNPLLHPNFVYRDFMLFSAFDSKPVNVVFNGVSHDCNYLLFCLSSVSDSVRPTSSGRSVPFFELSEEFSENLYFSLSGSYTKFIPCLLLYDSSGNLLEQYIYPNGFSSSVTFFINSGNLVSWYNINTRGLNDIIGLSDVVYSNAIYIGNNENEIYSESPPVSNIYDGLAEDILNVPVTDFPVGSDGTIAIDDGMVNDLEKAFENVIGVAEGVGDNATDEEKKQVISDSIAGEIDNVIDNAQERVETQNPSVPSNPSVGYPEVGDLKTDGLIDKFPFCIPFDLISLIKAFEAEPEAPLIEIPFVVPVFGSSDNIVIDFSKFEYIAVILRSLEVVGFVLFLILKTRDLIKG